jgi:hypothetical protein
VTWTYVEPVKARFMGLEVAVLLLVSPLYVAVAE